MSDGICAHDIYGSARAAGKDFGGNSMDALLTNMNMVLAIIGALAFCVSVITQVFKGVGFLSKIPTDALVFVLSIGITVAAFVAYMQYINMVILWYMILAAIMAGFIVAFVAMYGWEKLTDLWKRMSKTDTSGKW